MRPAALAIAMGLAAPAQAQDGWTDVEAGKRHDKSGLVCPAEAGGFELKSASGDAASFNCRYELRCRAAEGCTHAVGFASVTWDPAKDFAAQFTGLAASQKLALVADPTEPAWAGPPRLFATGGAGENASYAGWWLIHSNGQPLDIGVLYNAAGEEAANALVGATALANP
ncbi:MAG: hypothetical protein WDN24_10905 [Sphingomonas sp.]